MSQSWDFQSCGSHLLTTRNFWQFSKTKSAIVPFPPSESRATQPLSLKNFSIFKIDTAKKLFKQYWWNSGTWWITKFFVVQKFFEKNWRFLLGEVIFAQPKFLIFWISIIYFFILLEICKFLVLNENLIFVWLIKVLNRSLEDYNMDLMGRANMIPLGKIDKWKRPG